MFYDLFSGREQIFLTEHLEEGKKRVFHPIHREWNLDDIKEHWNGDMTIAQYVIRSNKTVNYAVIDVDISSHYLTRVAFNKQEYEIAWKKAKQDSLRIQKTTANFGISCYVVDSGYKGCHVWFFFIEPIQLSVAFEFLCKVISYSGSPSEGITWQLCPNQKKLKEGHLGQAIKLPWGKHLITGRQAWFLDEHGKVITDQPSILHQIIKISRQQVIQFIQVPKQSNSHEKQSKRDMLLPPAIQFIMNGCPVARHMVEKAKNTGFLTHSERLLLLNIFGPMGEEARNFLHQVMSHTMNYRENVTQKYIARSYNRPISCVRIREHFPSLTSQLNCNCKFPHINGAYHSPVLHNTKNKHLVMYTPNKEQKKKIKTDLETSDLEVNQRMNSQLNKIELDEKKQINQLATQLIEMRKHQRGIMNKIKKIERELTIYFDKNGIEQVEIDLGFLIREWHEDGYSWVIHL